MDNTEHLLKLLEENELDFAVVEGFFDINEDLVLNALYCSTGAAFVQLSASLEAQNPFDLAGSIRIDVPENSIKVTKVSQNQWKVSCKLLNSV